MYPEPRRRARFGFSLIELLIVIAIILILLAVAVPNFREARLRALELAAENAIGTIQTEQAQYFSQYGQYATSLAELGPPANGSPGPNGANLIDRQLASGKRGNFEFTLQASPTGYAITAVPTLYGTSGSHTFYSDENGGIHYHTGRQIATANDPVLGEMDPQQQAKE
jgi:type IV pilus assembly protein PilA